jgi:hypothetical protein
MVAVPIQRSSTSAQAQSSQAISPYSDASAAASPNWTHFLAAGTIVAGGALIAAGRRRTGVAVAAAGTALALLEEQEVVKEWWKALPGYLNDTQEFLDRIEHYLQEVTVQGHRIHNILKP